MARPAALLLAAVLPVLAVGCGGVDRGSYVKANQRLFTALPSYPGAQLRSETSTAYRSSETGPVAGYGTRFDLRLPEAATAAGVASFFRRRLRPHWRLVETLDGAVFNFRRSTSFVSVNLKNARIHSLEIAVDHAYYGKLGR